MNELQYVDEYNAEVLLTSHGDGPPDWYAVAAGDKDSRGPMGIPLTFAAEQWPVGTRLTVEVPCCPQCSMPAEPPVDGNDVDTCTCGFDWKEWRSQWSEEHAL